MQHLPIAGLLALLFLVSCSSETDPITISPVNEYLVVGNDRGYRDDFINQANLITVYDSSLAVRSLRSADNVRSYPIVDGYLQGGNDPALHWAVDSIGQDTIALLDTARNCTFYLHRLSRVDSLPGALELLTSGELGSKDRLFFRGGKSSFVFNLAEGSAGCLINRSYRAIRDWSSAKNGEIPKVDYYVRTEGTRSLWRFYYRFAQPLLVQDNFERGMTVSLLDSISSGRDTLYGRTISDRSFQFAPPLCLYKLAVAGLDPEVLTTLPQRPVRIESLDPILRRRYRSRWYKDEKPEDYIVVAENEVPELELSFTKNEMVFRVEDLVLANHAYRLHETSPYLVVGDDCTPKDYWHYQLNGDSITFTIPIRVGLPDERLTQTFNIDGKQVTLEPVDFYATEEWKATYVIPDDINQGN